MKVLPLLAAFILISVISYLYISKDRSQNADPNLAEEDTTLDIPEKKALDTPNTPPKEETGDVTEKPAPLQEGELGKHCIRGKKTIDGTGVYYFGREIAQVMGHPAINWLERSSREAEESPRMAIDMITLAKGETLADIGAGSGYYSFRLAMKNPESKVVSVDIQPEMLDFLNNRKEQLAVENLRTQLGRIDSINLPAESIDAALMVDAYHEFSHPYEMIKSIYDALRPGGRIYLLEYRAEDPNVPIKPLHKMTEAQSKKEMAAVGMKWEKTMENLPWQHFMIFRKP